MLPAMPGTPLQAELPTLMRSVPSASPFYGSIEGLPPADPRAVELYRADPKLWEVEVFKVIIQAVVLTGLLNMVLAFHFTSNKGSEIARENTAKAFEAITAAANASSAPDGAVAGAQAVADAARCQVSAQLSSR